MKKSTIQKQYTELLHAVQTHEFYTRISENRTNNYECKSCQHITKTIDIDKGVTPFIIRCRKCNSEAISNFYYDSKPSDKPELQFYRPTLEETYTLSTFAVDHVLKGGLLLKPID